MSFKGNLLAAVVAALAPLASSGWDSAGHRIVSQLALNSLPADYPSFARTPESTERILFLSRVADEWSHSPDLPLRHENYPEHYFDYEQVAAAGLDPATIPSFRLEFITAFAAGRAANAAHFPAIDPARNTDRTRQWPGFLPWEIAAQYGKLRAAFASLKAYETAGTPAEVSNARATVVAIMGEMSHYAGDCAQPLHTTNHFNGWVGANPQGFTTARTIHAWVDGGLIAKAGIRAANLASRTLAPRVLPTAVRPDARDPIFVASWDFLVAQHQLVVPLYRLEKEGKLGAADNPAPVSPEGRAFVETQLLKGAQMLGSLWLTAWRTSVPDGFLLGELQRRAP